MTMKNYQIAGDMSVYDHMGNDVDSVRERVIQKNRFATYVNDRMREWFDIPYKKTVWVEVRHSGRIDISGKYRFDSKDKERMNRILRSVIEAAGRETGMVTYGSIYFFADQKGWEVRS